MRNLLIILFLLSGALAQAQFSPGELSAAHAELEGMDNCSSCHEAGNRVPDIKCLECHTEINSLISRDRGYHSSREVQTQTCVDCHSEHHGRRFNSVRFEEDEFNHNLTSYELEGAHNRIECRDCHQPSHIANREIRRREGTYLGLGTSCLSCHTDYHQATLGTSCVDCHSMETFEEAPRFNHDKTDYPLRGAHRNVDCIECHQKGTRNGLEFQEFAGVAFGNCTDCHDDVHNGQFGLNCTECHNVNDWHRLNAGTSFDHNLTDYPLEGKHAAVECRECHTTGNYRVQLNYAQCTDCHDDYHEGDFAKESGGVQDCAECHDVLHDFTWSSYSIDDHNESDWPLEGAHIATPCFACHKPDPNPKWDFTFESNDCVSCHDDAHDGYISAEFYPEKNCRECHSTERWSAVSFDHNQTNWTLEGAHSEVDCKACHWVGGDELQNQQFIDRSTDCSSCHDNVHGDQFEVNGITDCARCHSLAATWNISTFNHNETEFPLDGRHAQVACAECHQPKIDEDGVERVEYSIPTFECVDCHGSN